MRQSLKRKAKKHYPTTKRVLVFVATGAFIAGSLVFPGLPILLKGKELDLTNLLAEDSWDEFDESRLRQKLKQLHAQKVVKIYEVDDGIVVKITRKGKKKLLKYKLDELEIPIPDKWDGKWRIVAWDIPKELKFASEAIRKTLVRLGFLKLQKSVYLFPYPCADAIEFLRQVYGVGEHVTFLTVGYLESESAYKEYFGL